MTNFTATVAVQLTAAQIQAAFSFLASSPIVEVHTGTEFKAKSGDGSIEVDLHGSGFTYLPQKGPTGGTITSLYINMPAGSFPHAYSFTGLSIPVLTAVYDVNHGKFGALLHALLPGNDVIKGSSQGDYLNDYGGHDRITGGAGNDTMSGSHGYDTFVFHTGFGQDQITHFVVSGSNHDNILLYADTGITKANLAAHESYNSATHVIVLTDTALDTVTISGVSSKSAFNADLHFHA